MDDRERRALEREMTRLRANCQQSPLVWAMRLTIAGMTAALWLPAVMLRLLPGRD